jgi:hypothetical protein
MAGVSKIDVTYASDVRHDDFSAEFWCGEVMWGEMAFDANASNYEGAYTLTIYSERGTDPIVLSVAELERALQIAKYRITPSRTE